MAILLYIVVLTIGIATVTQSMVCNKYCDGRDPALAVNPRKVSTMGINGRSIINYISDEDAMVYATIKNATPGDALWLERTFPGETTWKIGYTKIPPGQGVATTLMYNIYKKSANSQNLIKGEVQSCGQPKNVNNSYTMSCGDIN